MLVNVCKDVLYVDVLLPIMVDFACVHVFCCRYDRRFPVYDPELLFYSMYLGPRASG